MLAHCAIFLPVSSSPSERLDPGIAPFVEVLRHHGIDTFESCEGGRNHTFPVPTIRFNGDNVEGYKAVWVALTFGPMPLAALKRTWDISYGELAGPIWEVTFHKKATPKQAKEYADILASAS